MIVEMESSVPICVVRSGTLVNTSCMFTLQLTLAALLISLPDLSLFDARVWPLRTLIVLERASDQSMSLSSCLDRALQPQKSQT